MVSIDNSEKSVKANTEKPTDTSPEPNEPPISITSYLSMIWGHSLELSEKPNQNTTGVALRTMIYEILDTFKIKRSEQDLICKREIHEKFINDLSLSTTKAIHNISSLNNLHSSFIAEEKSKLERLKKIKTDRANLTSFSKEGLLSKFISFAIGGTASFPLLTYLRPPPNSKIESLTKLLELTKSIRTEPSTVLPVTKTENITETVTKSGGDTNIVEPSVEITETTTVTLSQPETLYTDTLYTDTTAYDSVIQYINNTTSSLINDTSPQYDFLLIILFGFVGIGIMMLINKFYNSDKRFQKRREERNCRLENYMKRAFRPQIKAILLDSYNDYKRLAWKHYFSNDDGWKNFEDKEFRNNCVNCDNVKSYLDKIIPEFLFDYKQTEFDIDK